MRNGLGSAARRHVSHDCPEYGRVNECYGDVSPIDARRNGSRPKVSDNSEVGNNHTEGNTDYKG